MRWMFWWGETGWLGRSYFHGDQPLGLPALYAARTRSSLSLLR
jgi:hypothetical protein